jgi:hypothetical protein
LIALTPVKITLYARVGDSEVLNEIGTIEEDVEWRVITAENRRPGDAAEAEAVIENFNLVGALRAAADRLEAGRT